MKASQKTKRLAARKPQMDGYNLPSHNALAQILPGYQCRVTEATTDLQNVTQQEKKGPEAAQTNRPNINHTFQVHHPHKRPMLLPDLEENTVMAEITDLQNKEVGTYRSAMSKMAEDIIALRTQVVTLEAENSQLRSDLSLHQDLGRHLLDDADIAVMTKAEIADRIASLKFKLASETSKVATQRDRIQQLQNELIKKNDSEKELLKLNRVQQQQRGNVQHRQSHMANMATLEVTVNRQEKVIEKMEKALESKLREMNRQGKTDRRGQETELALMAENTRLREELDRIHRQPLQAVIHESAQTKEVLPLREKLALLNKLEKAEARVQTLEAQLEENSKSWGRKKQELLTKLSEHRHGFVPTASTVFHNVPAVS